MRLFGLIAAVGLLGLTTVAAADPCEGPLPAPGTSFSGQVRYVGDGDSLCVGSASDPRLWIEVRIADFYAPELHAPGGGQAKAELERLALGRTVQCRAGHRSYDRVVARCTLDGRSLGELMRRAGVREGGNGR
jgi:micrococcal nuclease